MLRRQVLALPLLALAPARAPGSAPAPVALLRHALAPGTGDPPGFRLDDCATQRNLSQAGRVQARAIGAMLVDRGFAGARVLSSRWCRCLETARLLGLGPVEPAPELDSLFEDRAEGPARTRALRALLAGRHPAAPLVLVTHQVNITALTGVVPTSGETLILDAAGQGVTVRERIRA